MVTRESIRRFRREMLERQHALKAEIAALEEVKRANLRKVVSTLPEVPPTVEEYLCSPNPFLSEEQRTAESDAD